MKFNQKCWEDASELDSKIYICSYCNKEIASNIGYLSKGSHGMPEDYIYTYVIIVMHQRTLDKVMSKFQGGNMVLMLKGYQVI